MSIERRVPLNIDIEKLLQGCESQWVTDTDIAEYKERYNRVLTKQKRYRESHKQQLKDYREKNAEQLAEWYRQYYQTDDYKRKYKERRKRRMLARGDEINAKRRARYAAKKAEKERAQRSESITGVNELRNGCDVATIFDRVKDNARENSRHT